MIGGGFQNAKKNEVRKNFKLCEQPVILLGSQKTVTSQRFKLLCRAITRAAFFGDIQTAKVIVDNSGKVDLSLLKPTGTE